MQPAFLPGRTIHARRQESGWFSRPVAPIGQLAGGQVPHDEVEAIVLRLVQRLREAGVVRGGERGTLGGANRVPVWGVGAGLGSPGMLRTGAGTRIINGCE